jgi:hypothetical protein
MQGEFYGMQGYGMTASRETLEKFSGYLEPSLLAEQGAAPI